MRKITYEPTRSSIIRRLEKMRQEWLTDDISTESFNIYLQLITTHLLVDIRELLLDNIKG